MIVFLDTNLVVYAVESHPVFGVRAQTRIASALAAGDASMISDLVRMDAWFSPFDSRIASFRDSHRGVFHSPN